MAAGALHKLARCWLETHALYRLRYTRPPHEDRTFSRDLCEVRAEAEETVDDLKLKTEPPCIVCEVRTKKRLTIWS
jgi:hypothetical protein